MNETKNLAGYTEWRTTQKEARLKKIGVAPEVLLMNLAKSNSADSSTTRPKRKKKERKYFACEGRLPPYETITPSIPPAGEAR